MNGLRFRIFLQIRCSPIPKLCPWRQHSDVSLVRLGDPDNAHGMQHISRLARPPCSGPALFRAARAKSLFLLVALAATFSAGAAINETSFTACSLLGGSNDAVRGARIQSDGAIVLSANVAAGPLLQSVGGAKGGIIIRLAPGGGKVLGATRVAAEVRDLAIDAQDNIFVALGRDGAVKLDRNASKELWRKDTGGLCARLDAGTDGTCAVLNYENDSDTATGAGTVLVLAPDGRQVGTFKGRPNTIDVAVDGASRTILMIGFRQANAFDGRRREPVQIAHLTGRGYDGTEKYHLYDWSVDTNAPGFINKPENNMADTRGYRCAIGADAKLYAAFECAGGNHIFRYEPRLVNGQWVGAKDKKAKGDQYHAFHNSRAEHKTYVARFDPGSGEFLRGQEFTARLPSGRANAVRVKGGAVAAGIDGAVYLGGTSASGLPVTFTPPGTGDYAGGGFVLGLTPALDGRLFCVRLQAGAESHAMDVRQIGDKTVVVCGGTTSAKAEPFWTKNAVQSEAPPKAGFFAVFAID